jgi:hypothetical protein
MSDNFSKAIMIMLCIVCFFWTVVAGVFSVIMAIEKDSALFIPLSAVVTGLVVVAINKQLKE